MPKFKGIGLLSPEFQADSPIPRLPMNVELMPSFMARKSRVPYIASRILARYIAVPQELTVTGTSTVEARKPFKIYTLEFSDILLTAHQAALDYLVKHGSTPFTDQVGALYSPFIKIRPNDETLEIGQTITLGTVAIAERIPYQGQQLQSIVTL